VDRLTAGIKGWWIDEQLELRAGGKMNEQLELRAGE
jgi:hypothetical protein